MCLRVLQLLNFVRALPFCAVREAFFRRGAASFLQAEVETIIGDTTLSAACLEFSGVFRPSYRLQCLAGWRGALERHGLHVKAGYSLQTALSSPEEIQKWVMQGLPDDELSIENAAISLRAQSCPMLIDPHQQAAPWLAHTFPDMKVCRSSLTCSNSRPPYFSFMLENAFVEFRNIHSMCFASGVAVGRAPSSAILATYGTVWRCRGDRMLL